MRALVFGSTGQVARELRRDMSAAVLRRIAVATRSSVAPSDEDFTPTPVPPRN